MKNFQRPIWSSFRSWIVVAFLVGVGVTHELRAELGQGTISALLMNVNKTVGSETTPAVVGDVISSGGKIATRSQSLAELSFPDGSKIRIGNNSVFSFEANQRTVTLERGTALVCTPPKADGINVVSGGVSGTIPGDPAGKTFMITAYPPDAGGAKPGAGPGPNTGGFGVMVLQGNSATTVSAPSGSVSIAPGQFALVGPASSGAPKVFNVDIAQVFRSSPLVNAFPVPLPTATAILQTATQQQGSVRTGALNSTGTTGLAVASDGTILTGSSKPKSSAFSFTMASATPGSTGQQRNATAQEKMEDMETAAGGGGGGGPVGGVTGFAGGPGRFGRFTTPTTANTPNNSGQQANRNRPAPISATATVVRKEYDGTTDAQLSGATLNQPGNNISLIGTSTGVFASKNVGTGIAVSSGLGITGFGAPFYIFTPPNLVGEIFAKALTMTGSTVAASAGNPASREYDGTRNALVTVGTLRGEVPGEQLGTTTAIALFNTKDVLTANSITVRYTLVDGPTGDLASNYSLADEFFAGPYTITPKTITTANSSAVDREYNGTTLVSVLTGGLIGLVGPENLTVIGTGVVSSKDAGTGLMVNASYVVSDGSHGGWASNYTPLANEVLSVNITKKTLTFANPTVASRTYNGSTTASVTLGSVQGLVGNETLGLGESYAFADKNVGTGKTVNVTFNPTDGANGGKTINYQLNNLTLSADITPKFLDVDMSAAVTSKVYDGSAVVAVVGADLGRVAVGAGSDTDGKAYENAAVVSLAANPSATLERSLPGTFIPVSTTSFSLAGPGAGNYTLRQPTGLTGEITGSVSLDRGGSALSLSSGQFFHLRNTTATRMQDGLQIRTTSGQILIESSRFDGWMKRDNTARVVNGATGTTISFSETANVAVVSPVVRVKLAANTAAGAPGFMLLGDYQMRLQRDPDSSTRQTTPVLTGDERSATLFSFPGIGTDPLALGSLAPSADLVLRDTASGELQAWAYDAPVYTRNGSGQTVSTANYAAVQGEFNPDGAAAMSDLNTPTAAGAWNVTLDQPVISGEAKVTDVRLKYNNNTKALIEGPNGVRLVNVVFEGMDQIDVRTADLNNRVLMSGTLVSDPDISKLVVQVGQKLEAHFNSDITLTEVTRRGADATAAAANAVILAGVREKAGGGLEFIPGSPDRILEMQSATVAGQLSLASATVVFNNANIVSGGVIQVNTRDGAVNRTYGTVVPGTVSFIGANGNRFENTAANLVMNVANSGDISRHITPTTGGGTGMLSEVGSAHSGTVMNVGKVQ